MWIVDSSLSNPFTALKQNLKLLQQDLWKDYAQYFTFKFSQFQKIFFQNFTSQFQGYVTVCGKTRPKSPGKIREKRGKVKKKAPPIHFIHLKVQKYVQKCLKIAPNVIKINSIQTSKITFNTFFLQVLKDEHFKM
jgi:hypothetical protein